MGFSTAASLGEIGLEIKDRFVENWHLMDMSPLVRQLGSWSVGRGSLQHKLAAALTLAIRQGVLNPGVRLPSERLLAQALAVSRTTVVAAYDSLREGGWLESRAGSGTWVCRRSTTVATARSTAHAAALAASPLVSLLREQED